MMKLNEEELLDALDYLYSNANQWIINEVERLGKESAYTFLESDSAYNMLLRLIKEYIHG